MVAKSRRREHISLNGKILCGMKLVYERPSYDSADVSEKLISDCEDVMCENCVRMWRDNVAIAEAKRVLAERTAQCQKK